VVSQLYRWMARFGTAKFSCFCVASLTQSRWDGCGATEIAEVTPHWQWSSTSAVARVLVLRRAVSLLHRLYPQTYLRDVMAPMKMQVRLLGFRRERRGMVLAACTHLMEKVCYQRFSSLVMALFWIWRPWSC